MNFENKINKLLGDAELALKDIKELKIAFENAKDFTCKFLGECKTQGITKVSIGVKSKRVPASFDFPFSQSTSIFQFVPKGVKQDWPLIWGVCEKMGVSEGAGNSDQHQANMSSLVDGVYELRKGKWIKTE